MNYRKQVKKLSFFVLNILLQKKYLNNIILNNQLTILNLHRVSPESNLFYPPLHPKLFEELLLFLTKHFNVITFREIGEYAKSEKPNVILSFDDGFKDYVEYAVPIMEKHGVRSNQNIIPNCLETNEAMWDVKLFDFLNASPLSLIHEISLPGFEMKINEKNKVSYGLALMKYLKSQTKMQREELFGTLDHTVNKNQNIRYTEMMSKKDVLEVSHVHEIGSHSYYHESMNRETKAFFVNDFFKCQRYFKEILELPFDIYAFPNGGYQAYQLDFLEQQGIKHILLVDEEYSNNKTSRHHRFTYYADSKSEIKMRALGFKI